MISLAFSYFGEGAGWSLIYSSVYANEVFFVKNGASSHLTVAVANSRNHVIHRIWLPQGTPLVFSSYYWKFDSSPFGLSSPSLTSLWFVGIQLVWQQTNQVQEEYRQVSGRSQPLRCEDSRDGCARSSRSRAEQPDQLAHHAKLWCVQRALSLLASDSPVPQSPVPQAREPEPCRGHSGCVKEELY